MQFSFSKICYKYKARVKHDDEESQMFLGVNQCIQIFVTTELVCGTTTYIHEHSTKYNYSAAGLSQKITMSSMLQ